jgi:hypothetical protein
MSLRGAPHESFVSLGPILYLAPFRQWRPSDGFDQPKPTPKLVAKQYNGYRAQLWLAKEHGFKLGNSTDTDKDYVAIHGAYKPTYDYNAVISKVYDHRIISNLGNSGVTVAYRLHLDTTTGISVRLKPNSGTISKLQIDQGMVDSVLSDGSHVVRLNGIPAHKLAERLNISGTTSSGNDFSVDVCVLSYVRTTLLSSDDTLAKDAMAALLEYYEAAKAFQEGVHQGEGATA